MDQPEDKEQSENISRKKTRGKIRTLLDIR